MKDRPDSKRERELLAANYSLAERLLRIETDLRVARQLYDYNPRAAARAAGISTGKRRRQWPRDYIVNTYIALIRSTGIVSSPQAADWRDRNRWRLEGPEPMPVTAADVDVRLEPRRSPIVLATSGDFFRHESLGVLSKWIDAEIEPGVFAIPHFAVQVPNFRALLARDSLAQGPVNDEELTSWLEREAAEPDSYRVWWARAPMTTAHAVEIISKWFAFPQKHRPDQPDPLRCLRFLEGARKEIKRGEREDDGAPLPPGDFQLPNPAKL